MWSTIESDRPMNLLDVLNVCSVRLIYLGSLRFGVLIWRPRPPKKVATKSPSFNIVEEYTIDEDDKIEQPQAGKPASVALPVGTDTTLPTPKSISVGITPNQPTSEGRQDTASRTPQSGRVSSTFVATLSSKTEDRSAVTGPVNFVTCGNGNGT